MKKINLINTIKKINNAIKILLLTIFLSGCGGTSIIDRIVGQPDRTKIDFNTIIESLKEIANFMQAGVAVVATIFFMWGGILYLSSFGDKEKMEKGKKTVMWAIIAIILLVTGKIVLEYLISLLWFY